jgi:DNA-binding NarL/FixJ family response regulator
VHLRESSTRTRTQMPVASTNGNVESQVADHLQPAEDKSLAVMSPPTTLIVADDHPLFRSALREAVSRLLPQALILEAGSLAELEDAVQAHPTADLVLLDLRMPGAHGFSQLIHLRTQYPSIPVALISAAESASIVRRALDFGASGFIPKSASIETIGAMLGMLLEGKVAVPEDYAGSSSDRGHTDRELARNVARLTPQQHRVLLLLAEGHSNKTIAQDLDVSEATIKAHVTVILRKLGLERRTQAALLAQRLFRTDPSDEMNSESAYSDDPEA